LHLQLESAGRPQAFNGRRAEYAKTLPVTMGGQRRSASQTEPVTPDSGVRPMLDTDSCTNWAYCRVAS